MCVYAYILVRMCLQDARVLASVRAYMIVFLVVCVRVLHIYEYIRFYIVFSLFLHLFPHHTIT